MSASLTQQRVSLLSDKHAKSFHSIGHSGLCSRKTTRIVGSIAGREDVSTQTSDHSQPQKWESWPSAAARQASYSSAQLESVDSSPTEVSGRIPVWLAGQFLRNGPGIYDNGTSEGMVHMFDGYGLVVKLTIDGATNNVKSSHRFVNSDAYKHYKATGSMRWREFATAVPHENVISFTKELVGMILGTMGVGKGVTDNASVNIIPQSDGKVWAVTETVAGTLTIDPETLETLGHVTYNDSLKGDITTAHPTVLPNGDIVNILSTVGVGYNIYRQSSKFPPSRELIATVPHRRPLSPAWIHDFPGTANYVVIPDTPMFFNLGALMLGKDTPHVFMDWVPEAGALMHVVRLRDGVVKSYKTPAFFAFHWANAHESEDGRYLYMDGAVYKDPTILNDLYLKPLRAGPEESKSSLSSSSLRRLTIDLEAPDGSEISGGWQPLIKDESSHGNWAEFPKVSPLTKGKPYRYVWTTCVKRPTNAGNALAKVDTIDGTCTVWTQPGGLVGEPLFVPRPGATVEDDGVVIVMVTEADGRASMLFVDGKSHCEVARAKLPYSLPNGFHGTFISKAS